MCRKVFVDVNANFKADGTIIPLSIKWEDGTVYRIDQVLKVCRAASLKAGGAGIRYTCRIGNNITNIFLEENAWFVEAKNSPKFVH